MKPIVYAALPTKNVNTYDMFLNELIVYAQTIGISLVPKSVLIDFEMVANIFQKCILVDSVLKVVKIGRLPPNRNIEKRSLNMR